MFPATHCWNASVWSSAAQDSSSPSPPALLVIGPPPGHVHSRSDPVATSKTWIAGPPTEESRRATASLLPSGESAMSKAPPGCRGMGSAVSRVVRPPAPMCSRKNFVGASRMNFPPSLYVTAHGPATRTKVRPSPAPAAAMNVRYGLGGVIRASVAPVAVARTSANCRCMTTGLGFFPARTM